MLSVREAFEIVREHARPLPPRDVQLGPSTLGLVLAEEITSDIDMPPYDKALMDGFAVRAQDLDGGRGVLQILEEITAGQAPRSIVGPKQASQIMTGAPIPSGADSVVMIERTKQVDDQRVAIEDSSFKAGQNVLPRAKEMHRGEAVLAPGAVLRPQEIGVLATVGRATVRVIPAPEVAVLPTGDEIVEPSQQPGPAQVRNSNATTLLAQVQRAGGLPRYLGIGRDRLDSLIPLVTEGLTRPVLVLAGGVSAGKKDLVPEVLRTLGVEAHFHKVEMKPGKPIFFGTRERTLVFGLPGNPVSAFICFELFVRPAIRILAGHRDSGPRVVNAVLEADFSYRSDRPTYHPAILTESDRGWKVRPTAWFGSADLRGLLGANTFALLHPGDHRYAAGTMLQVLKVES